jgi:hypothetical protein
MLPSGPNAVRAVFCLDITDSDVERASELAGEALHSLEQQPEEARSAIAHLHSYAISRILSCSEPSSSVDGTLFFDDGCGLGKKDIDDQRPLAALTGEMTWESYREKQLSSPAALKESG